MRILFTTTPRLGHFHPLVGLAGAARAAGHEVAFACARSLCASVTDSGFEALPLNDDSAPDPELTAALARLQGVPAGEARTAAYLMEVFIGLEARRALPGMVAHCRTWKPDLIVREEYELAGAIAAEASGLPHAVVQVTYSANWQQQAAGFGGVVAEHLDRLRASVGLPPDPDLEMLYRHLFVSFDPPSLLDPAVSLPERRVHLRPSVFDRSSPEALPAWLTPQTPRPLVYASLGTIAPTLSDIFPAAYQKLLDGLQGFPGSVAVTLGRDRDPALLGPQAEHVHVERYIPQSLVLAHCDLIVTHGGHNTVLAALCHGLPMVVVPFFADQGSNAARVAALGAGQVIPGKELTPERLRESVRDGLGNLSYREAARRLRAEIEALPGLEVGVRQLERLVLESSVHA